MSAPAERQQSPNQPRERFRRMVARDRDERHRASTPLELLVDLSFVVAVAQVAAELHHGIASGHVGASIQGYLMVFFAVWWAWMNFTWFASAYDTDDVPYRLLTFVQIAGVLVLAAGVPAAFEHGAFGTITLGYAIMRVALVGQWLRVARDYPPGRATALRYAAGVSAVQVGWILRLALPDAAATPSFLVLVLLELAIPPFAERSTAATAWHPEHIAERYGLFTLIVLGESILAATTAIQGAVHTGGLTSSLVSVAVGGLLIIFTLWWRYFARPADETLRDHPSLAFFWGYAHYVLFSSAAALGAGLQVAADHFEGTSEISASTAALAVAIPVVLYLTVLLTLQRRLWRHAAD